MLYYNLNIFGGQNIPENLIKALVFSVSVGIGTISRNSHMSWAPWELKTSVPVVASFHFLSALNLRNAWPTKNYITNKFQEFIHPVDIKTLRGGHLT